MIRELRQSVNQCDVNSTQISPPGGFRRFIEIFKMVGDRHEGYVPVPHVKNYLGLGSNP